MGYNRAMQWTPHVVVAAIVEQSGRFLVVEERAEGRTVINQPAGHLERDESLIEAVRREVLEETGCAFTPQGVVGVYLYPRPELDHAFLRVCFFGVADAREPGRALDADILRTLWASRAELEAERARLRSPLVLACIDDYLAGQRHPLGMVRRLTGP